VAAEAILTTSQAREIGYLGWSWSGTPRTSLRSMLFRTSTPKHERHGGAAHRRRRWLDADRRAVLVLSV